MGTFSNIVRQKMKIERGLPVRANPELPRQLAHSAMLAGYRAISHLRDKIPACSLDPRCEQVQEVLKIANDQGTPADHRTALTQLQTLLRELTEEDSDVSADDEVQRFRKRLHLLLDH
jgi:hypothetical protein